ncbi:MAG: pyrimidine reductase family protein [Jatrophihabitans sp.]
MRALLPVPGDSVDVHEWYAHDWVAEGGIRANFISSADGAVSADGLSRGLQTDGDNRVFAALRDLADVILVGAGTARAERYGAVSPQGARLAARRRHGLPDELPIAVVSGRLDLDPTSELFTAATANARTIVVTTAAAPTDKRAALASVADLLIAGETELDTDVLRAGLSERGLTRVVCEGGPSLFAALVRHGSCDELCLSISPVLVGGGPGRITAGPPLDGAPRGLSLVGLIEEDGALFARYRRSL